MADANPASSMIEGAFSLGALAYQDELNQNAAKQQQRWTVENQQRAMEQQSALMRVATPLAVQGMRDAGINPQSMKQAANVPSTPTAPQGAKPEPANVAESLAVGQMIANTRLLNAEAENKEIINSRENEADQVSKDAYLKQLMERIKIYDSKGIDTSGLQAEYDRIADSSSFNLGTFKANLQAMEMETKTLEAFTNKLDNLVKNAGLDKILNTHSAIEADLLESKLALQLAQSHYFMTSSAESQARIEEIGHKITEIDEHVTQMEKQGKLTDAQANNIINSDVATLLDNGEFKKAITAELVTGANSFAKGAGQGLGAVAGLKMGGLSKLGFAGSAMSRTAGADVTKRVMQVVESKIGRKNARKLYNVYKNDPNKRDLNFGEWIKHMEEGHAKRGAENWHFQKDLKEFNARLKKYKSSFESLR